MFNEMAKSLASLATILPAAAIYYDLFGGLTEERKQNSTYEKFVVSELPSDEAHYKERIRIAEELYESTQEGLNIRKESLERLASILEISFED